MDFKKNSKDWNIKLQSKKKLLLINERKKSASNRLLRKKFKMYKIHVKTVLKEFVRQSYKTQLSISKFEILSFKDRFAII